MCFHLGRSDFNNHNVRDAARNTTCPYLLNTKCKNCGYFGHTSAYCNIPNHLNPVLQKPMVKHIEIVNYVSKSKNAFDILCTQVDDHDHDKNVEDDELPDLSKVQWGKAISKQSWADQVEDDNKNSWS